MNELTISDEELEDIMKEYGPTYYDITGISLYEADLIEYLKNELKNIEKNITDPNSTWNIHMKQIAEKRKEYIDGRMKAYSESHNKEELINAVAFQKRALISDEEKKYRSLIAREREGNNNPDLISEYTKALEKLTDQIQMLITISDPKKREEYNNKVERKIREIKAERQKDAEYAEKLARKEELRRNRKLRREYSEKMVRKELGEAFNPDKSNCRCSKKDFESDSENSPLTTWKVELYANKKLYFEVETENKEYPELNQKVTVYRYGSFEYDNHVKPLMGDRTCEILGVRKLDIQGNIQEDFIIAQTLQLGHIERLSRRVIMNLEAKGVKLKVLLSPEQIRDMDRKERLEKIRERNKGILEKAVDKFKKMRQGEQVDQEVASIDLDEEQDVMIFEKVLAPVSDEEKERFARLYLSDYVMDSVIKNNARYIGSVIQPLSELDSDGIFAASYAAEKPGILVDQVYKFPNETKVKVNNIDVILDIIRDRERTNISSIGLRNSSNKDIEISSQEK